MGTVPPSLSRLHIRDIYTEDYEQPRAEYPFNAPPEPDKFTDLGPGLSKAWFQKDNFIFSYKREFVRRMIDNGSKKSELFWGESVEVLAREVGLWQYYQSRNGNKV